MPPDPFISSMTSWYHFCVVSAGGTPKAPFATGPAMFGIMMATFIVVLVTPGALPAGAAHPWAPDTAWVVLAPADDPVVFPAAVVVVATRPPTPAVPLIVVVGAPGVATPACAFTADDEEAAPAVVPPA